MNCKPYPDTDMTTRQSPLDDITSFGHTSQQGKGQNAFYGF